MNRREISYFSMTSIWAAGHAQLLLTSQLTVYLHTTEPGRLTSNVPFIDMEIEHSVNYVIPPAKKNKTLLSDASHSTSRKLRAPYRE